MEDARCLMRAKQRGIQGLAMSGSSHNLYTYAQTTQHNSYDVSWEERAFAEDAAGPHGGCVWPPRSYSCNFCRREFRSAQALGGHMNVHRRDRARLKQSLSPQESVDHHQPSQKLQHGSQSQKPFVASQFIPSQVCNLDYNPNPNPVTFDSTAPMSLALKISSPSGKDYISIDQETPAYIQLGLRKFHASNTPERPWSGNMAGADQNIQTPGLIMDAGKRDSQIKDLAEMTLMHYDKPDISVSLNLFLFQARPRKRSNNNEAADQDEDEEDGDSTDGGKRMKLIAYQDQSSAVSSSCIKSSIVDGCYLQQKVSPDQRSTPSSMHELDLELRLGEGPKVK